MLIVVVFAPTILCSLQIFFAYPQLRVVDSSC